MKRFFLTILFIFGVVGIAGAAPGEGHGGSQLKPFIFQLINFFIFIFVLYKVALPKIKTFFVERSQKIRLILKEAEEIKAESEKKLREYDEKLKSLHQKIEDLRATAEQEGIAEEEKIIKEAQKEAEIIIKQAKNIAEQEIKKARLELRQEVINFSLERATKIIKKSITKQDQTHLVADYMKQISSQS